MQNDLGVKTGSEPTCNLFNGDWMGALWSKGPTPNLLYGPHIVAFWTLYINGINHMYDVFLLNKPPLLYSKQSIGPIYLICIS